MGLPNPHLTTRKLSRSEKVEEGKEEQGFKDAHYSPPQLSSSEAAFSHTHLGKSESRTSPYPTSLAPPLAASPVRPPPPYYSIALGAKTDSSQELLQSAFLRLSWLLQPVSWLCSLRLCLGQSPFPLPPRPRLTQPLIQSLDRGGQASWAQVGGPSKVDRYLITRGTSAVRTVGGGRPSAARRPGTAPHLGRGWGRPRGLLEPRPGAETR